MLKLSVDGSFGNRTFEDARRINLKSKAAKAFQTYVNIFRDLFIFTTTRRITFNTINATEINTKTYMHKYT